jgi:hypothetical protein
MNGRVGLRGGGRGVVGFTLRGHYEGIKGIMILLTGAKSVWKRIALVGNLCLRGKVGRVGGRTLMKLKVVSPIVVPNRDGLRVAPDREKKIRVSYRLFFVVVIRGR